MTRGVNPPEVQPDDDGEVCMDPSGCDRRATVFIERPANWHDEALCEEHGRAALAALAKEQGE